MTNSIIFNGHQITDFTMDETGRFEVPANYYPPTIADAIKQLHDLGLVAFNNTSSNDVCDSIAFLSKDKSTEVKIFVPNADITDIEQEMFDTFSIQIFFLDNELLSCNGCEFDTWNEVLEFIKSQNF